VVEGEREQRVPGEDRDGLAVDDVAGGLAAAEVVVVHAGEVVVDERHGVHHLDGRGGGHRPGLGPTHHGARGQAQRRAHALPARQQRVPHRVVQRGGGFPGGDGRVQRTVHRDRALPHVRLEVELRGGRRGGGRRGHDGGEAAAAVVVVGRRDGDGGGRGGGRPRGGGGGEREWGEVDARGGQRVEVEGHGHEWRVGDKCGGRRRWRLGVAPRGCDLLILR